MELLTVVSNKHAGGATVCRGYGVQYCELQTRNAWLLVPLSSNPMGTIAVPLYIAVVFLGQNPPLIGGFH